LLSQELRLNPRNRPKVSINKKDLFTGIVIQLF